MNSSARIPAEVDRPDPLIGPLTARQLTILALPALVLYALWGAVHTLVPLPLFGLVAVPIGTTAVLLAVGQRDGVSLDRWAWAAIRHGLAPRYRVAAEGIRPVPAWLAAQATHPTDGARQSSSSAQGVRVSPAPLRLPAREVTRAATDIGILDLGADGLAVVAVCSTVNFALRTPSEQDGLVAIFGRFLHSLTGPVQILIRTQRLDLSPQIGEVRARAGGLPHPALEAAAREHADFLTQLGQQTDLLRRQVLLVLREPWAAAGPADGVGGPSPWAVLTSLLNRHRHRRGDGGAGDPAVRAAAETRLVRRLADATDLLAPAGIVVTALDGGQAAAVLAAACNPDTLLPASTPLATADDVITAGRTHVADPAEEQRWWQRHDNDPGDPDGADEDDDGEDDDTDDDMDDDIDGEFAEERRAA